jgi:hypothetical protein
MRSIALLFGLLCLPLFGSAQGQGQVAPAALVHPEERTEGEVEKSFRPSTQADLYIANRYILTLRSEVLGNTPEHHIEGIHANCVIR